MAKRDTRPYKNSTPENTSKKDALQLLIVKKILLSINNIKFLQPLKQYLLKWCFINHWHGCIISDYFLDHWPSYYISVEEIEIDRIFKKNEGYKSNINRKTINGIKQILNEYGQLTPVILAPYENDKRVSKIPIDNKNNIATFSPISSEDLIISNENVTSTVWENRRMVFLGVRFLIVYG